MNNKTQSKLYINDIVSKKSKYKNLVLSGGSTRGICHVGAVQKLIDSELIDIKQLKSITGASAGALYGCFLVLGFNNEEIWQFLQLIDTKKLIKPDIFMFLKNCGIESGQIIYNLMEDILTKKTGIENITFKQLYNITKIQFTIVGSCLTTKEVVYYDHIKSPNFIVSIAIRISISMPGFFSPVIIDNKKYIDGAILNNYPMNLYKDKLDDTIGILLCTDYNTDYKYPEEFFMAVVNLFMYHYYNEHADEYKNNTIYIKREDDGQSRFDFDLDLETKIKYYNIGYQAVEEFIRKNLNKKFKSFT